MSFEVLKRKMKEAQLRNKIQKKQKDAFVDGRFSLFHVREFSRYFGRNSNYQLMESMYEIIDGWDKSCNLPYDFGEKLSELASNDEYTVCIHRTRLDVDKEKAGIPESDDLVNIMENGLVNYGHSNAVGGSAFMSNSVPGLGLTTTPLVGIEGYINLVGSYHGNDATIIMVFPSNLVGKDGEIKQGIDPSLVYDLSGRNPVIKNEFLYGAVLKKNNGYDEFYTRDQIVQSKDMGYSDQNGVRK